MTSLVVVADRVFAPAAPLVRPRSVRLQLVARVDERGREEAAARRRSRRGSRSCRRRRSGCRSRIVPALRAGRPRVRRAASTAIRLLASPERPPVLETLKRITTRVSAPAAGDGSPDAHRRRRHAAPGDDAAPGIDVTFGRSVVVLTEMVFAPAGPLVRPRGREPRAGRPRSTNALVKNPQSDTPPAGQAHEPTSTPRVTSRIVPVCQPSVPVPGGTVTPRCGCSPHRTGRP